MTTAPRPVPLAIDVPLTKFRVPRLRRDTVGRVPLVATLRRLADEHPVTLVRAPAGSGKTTLLAQCAHAAAPGEAVVWIDLDEADDDPPRLLATLVQSLAPLALLWETDPRALVGNVSGVGSESRAVLAGLVNALCTATAPRVTWILDDLHRLASPQSAAVLEALIERLPQHVALVLGSRTEPALPLARLRAHGELGDLGAAELRFDAEAVVALARSRGQALPDTARVAEMLARTGGWAVGVNLVLAAGLPAARGGPRADAAPRALFDFLAEEVLAELPPTLRAFAVDCAVLPELDPACCRAVTGRDDARDLLDALLRRHLFVDVIDDGPPVLRFHDLFRDFLRAQLERLPAAHRAALHARAAAVEPNVERAIGHWLDAGRWDEAAGLIVAQGLDLVAAGAHAGLERWIDRLPSEVTAAEPRIALLRAECAWIRWDWPDVAKQARRAVDGLAERPVDAGATSARFRARLLLAAALGALGRLDERAALTEAALAEPLPDGDAAQFHLQRAWSAFSLGHGDAIAGHLAAMNALIARDPPALAPLVAPTLNCHFGGLPGVTEACLRFVALCDTVPKAALLPWHATPIVIGAWSALWQGRLDGVATALERAMQIQRSFGKVRYVLLDATHLAALSLAARGEFDGAVAIADGLLAELQATDAGGLRRIWLRPYRSVRARIAWIASDRDALRAQAAMIAGPREDGEWPFVAGAAETVAGQAALLDGDLAGARAALLRAVAHQARHPAPAFHADPRLALAACELAAGDPLAAWAAFGPMAREIARDATPGHLLLEPPARVQALLDAGPVDGPDAPVVAALRRRWSSMRRATGGGATGDGATGDGATGAGATGAGATGVGAGATGDRNVVASPSVDVAEAGRPPIGRLAALSEREREVLDLVAQGLPNKLLARRLALSPHTVKRHLANILDKLDCDNRGQAAALWRDR